MNIDFCYAGIESDSVNHSLPAFPLFTACQKLSRTCQKYLLTCFICFCVTPLLSFEVQGIGGIVGFSLAIRRVEGYNINERYKIETEEFDLRSDTVGHVWSQEFSQRCSRGV